MQSLENPYLLLTPGPLSTSRTVKETMLRDWCTWDSDYNQLVQNIREHLINLAVCQHHENYTCVLMQGSGSFCVESVIGSVVPADGKLLVLENGAYGQRIATMSAILGIETALYRVAETELHSDQQLDRLLQADPAISHVAMVHCETTTGILNPIKRLAEVAKSHGCVSIVDAMSSFGGIAMDMESWHIDFLISSANKCIEGVPGFGFIIADREQLQQCKGRARSHSLDLYDQWHTMEATPGKWRFTSPTHVVRAFYQALLELDDEGGVTARFDRYSDNHRILVEGMRELGFQTVIDDQRQSPFITTFKQPVSPSFSFEEFYAQLKRQGFVIYPGKITETPCFRIGHIGQVFPGDIRQLLSAIKNSRFWLQKEVETSDSGFSAGL